MGRTGLVAAIGVALIAACSGGGGKAAPTTTSSAATTTSSTTTTTTTPEDAVKAAYLAYWKMIDRLSAAPDPDDSELPMRIAEPLLSFTRDEMATRRSEGRTTRFPADPALNSHRIDRVSVAGSTASIDDCFVDGRIAVNADGTTNDAVVTKATKASLISDGTTWRVRDAEFSNRVQGVSGCAAR